MKKMDEERTAENGGAEGWTHEDMGRRTAEHGAKTGARRRKKMKKMDEERTAEDGGAGGWTHEGMGRRKKLDA